MLINPKKYYVYIMTNKANTVFYTGVTNDLLKRVSQHKEQSNDGFTKRYRISTLAYYEVCENVEGAIFREKQIKAGSRQKKINLIISLNSGWNDLYEELTKIYLSRHCEEGNDKAISGWTGVRLPPRDCHAPIQSGLVKTTEIRSHIHVKRESPQIRIKC